MDAGFCTVNYVDFTWNWLTGLSVLQQVKVMKSQVGGHAPTHRLNRNLNLFFCSARSGKSSECVGKLVNHCCVAKTTEERQKTTRDSGRPSRPSLHSTQIHYFIGKYQLLKSYFRCTSYLSGRIFNDLYQRNPCWHFWKTWSCQKGEKQRRNKDDSSMSIVHLKPVELMVEGNFQQMSSASQLAARQIARESTSWIPHQRLAELAS